MGAPIPASLPDLFSGVFMLFRKLNIAHQYCTYPAAYKDPSSAFHGQREYHRATMIQGGGVGGWICLSFPGKPTIDVVCHFIYTCHTQLQDSAGKSDLHSSFIKGFVYCVRRFNHGCYTNAAHKWHTGSSSRQSALMLYFLSDDLIMVSVPKQESPLGELKIPPAHSATSNKQKCHPGTETEIRAIPWVTFILDRANAVNVAYINCGAGFIHVWLYVIVQYKPKHGQLRSHVMVWLDSICIASC